MLATPTSSARPSTAHAESEACRAQPRHVVGLWSLSGPRRPERTHLPLSVRDRTWVANPTLLHPDKD